MSHSEVEAKTPNVKKENDVLGSLGALASYGGGSSSDLSEEEADSPTEGPSSSFWKVLNPDGKAPLCERTVKSEENIGDEEEGALPIAGAIDFATLNEGTKERIDLELNVEDLFPGVESYGEARAVKVEVESGTSDSDSDSEDSDSDETEEDDGEGAQNSDQVKNAKSRRKLEGPKVKGELGLSDLPPIEDLHISVPHEECKPIGVIKSVVEPLVIVEAHLGTPALDLDSVLFLDEGDRALGHIFDVIGPVKQPMYCVRFNSKEHIQQNKVEVGMSVYCAPKTPYTSYVFLTQLKRLKGSDASWLNDIEPPNEAVEFSDDEMEKIARKKKRNRKFQKARATEDDAIYKEGDDTGGTEQRGRKRHHNNEQQAVIPAASDEPSTHDMSANRFPPFMPPMIPGFIPYPPGYGPPVGYPSRGPAMHMNRHGGFPRPRGGGGFQRFQSPRRIGGPPEHYDGEFQQNTYRPPVDVPSWGPWCPPVQWQNQNFSHFNFGHFGASGQNPYQQMHTVMQPRVPPPPPPPPPPGQ